ncbi:SDR family oxidoreductase [Parapedobacter koreensis]|uniref:dTDP-4-dehydrorhamnose reductase n=1 Tax=Parapedobacter koreensis TaxID=332977 RepID=A0A1H7FYY5_9SPHI|nr:SDR family oxidoreductase [Parapedobacter koreensis]SEK31111.1 dTDP-4-dehydrorhamnose reductase [Parapedobacter koreensis]
MIAGSPLHTKKILVTGSNGLLGQKITDLALPGAAIELIATSRGENRHPTKEGYRYIDLDILDESRLRDVIAEYRPEVIINTAAMTNVDTCEHDPEGCHQLNVVAVAQLVSLSEEFGIHFIHLSTDFIFDGEDGPYAEDDIPRPLSLYGQSKLDAEHIIQQSSCKWAILRTILVYGVVADMSRSNIVLWAKGALEKGQPLKVVNDQWRTPTLAEDLAEACILAATKGAEGIYHISGKDMFAIHELVAAVADYWGLDKSLIGEVSSDTLNQAAPRPKRTGFLLDKARTVLGYEPHSFSEGLALVDRQLKNKK